MRNKITVSIPKELKEELDKKIKETNFESLNDYILYILEQTVSENLSESSNSRQAYTDEEEADIAGDLEMRKSLGAYTEKERGKIKENQTYTDEEEKELRRSLDEMGYL